MGPEGPLDQAGLRLGSANSAAAAALLASLSGRFSSGGSVETAVLQPLMVTGGLQQPQTLISSVSSILRNNHKHFILGLFNGPSAVEWPEIEDLKAPPPTLFVLPAAGATCYPSTSAKGPRKGV